MPVQTATESPVAQLQVEAVRALGQGFDNKDFTNGSEHQATLSSLVKSIATGQSTKVKIEGLRILGDYSVRTRGVTDSEFAQIQSVQDEAINSVASICVDEPDLEVKTVGLEQVARRLDLSDFRYGQIHGGAIDAIRRIATSVTMSETDPAAINLVRRAIEVLNQYSIRSRAETHSEYAQIADVQTQAKGFINLITTTVGVDKFSDLTK